MQFDDVSFSRVSHEVFLTLTCVRTMAPKVGNMNAASFQHKLNVSQATAKRVESLAYSFDDTRRLLSKAVKMMIERWCWKTFLQQENCCRIIDRPTSTSRLPSLLWRLFEWKNDRCEVSNVSISQKSESVNDEDFRHEDFLSILYGWTKPDCG